MSAFPIFSNVVERLGWVLVHSLWQFALIALLAALAVRLLHRHASAARYAVLSVALLVTVLVPTATWRLQPDALPVNPLESPPVGSVRTFSGADTDTFNSATTPVAEIPADVDIRIAGADTSWNGLTENLAAQSVRHGSEASLSDRAADLLRPWLGWIVAGWCVGVVLCSLRPLLGWHTLRRLRRVGVSPVSDDLLETLRRMCERLGLRRTVRMMHSSLAQAPLLVGYVRPVILLPVSLVTSVPAAQLEAILAHELAHVRRHDFLVNLLQTLAETVFFYHPAVWFLSGWLRAERENCCDDLVVATLGNRVDYGRALLAMEALRGRGSVLAIGVSDGSLLARIRRIAGIPSDSAASSPWSAVSLIVCGVVFVVMTSVLSWGSQAESSNTPAKPSGSDTSERTAAMDWGDPVNGLRARAAPVLSSMSEDAIDPAQRVARFEEPDDVAFVVELQNVSDKPIKLLDTRYGESYGESTGKANSNWYGQFLFSIDLFASDGKRIERPDVEVVDLNHVLDGALVVSVDPGETHRFLLRPARWLSALTQRIETGGYRAAVTYHGMPQRVANRIREYRPTGSVLEAVSGDVATTQVAFEVEPEPSTAQGSEPAVAAMRDLVWGEPNKGLRAAIAFTPSQAKYSHGDKPETKLHVQNVSDKPITLASQLWMSDLLNATVRNDKGDPVEVGATWYSGWTLTARVTLHPQQAIIYDAGNIGLALTKERAASFEDITNRTLVAPAGEYTMQLEGRFGDSLTLKDGKGKVLAPLEGDWVGVLKTGAAPLTLTNEVIECSIVDAVTGEPVAGATVNFRFIKPKSGDTAEEIVADIFWGPQAPGRIYFYVPDDVLRRDDRQEIEVQWGIGQHPDYEGSSSARRIPLKQFFTSDSKYLRDALGAIRLTPKRQAGLQKVLKPAFVLPDHLNVMAVGVSGDGKELVSVATEDVVTIRTWDVSEQKLKREVTLESDKHGNFFLSGQLTLSGDLRRVIAIIDGGVGIWDAATGKLVKNLTPPSPRQQAIRGLACTPDLSVVACGWTSGLGGFGRPDAGALVWDVASGKVLQTVQHVDAIQIQSVAVSADGKWLATGGQQAGTCIWEVSSGKLIRAVPNTNPDRQHPDPNVSATGASQVVCLGFSPDGKQLAIGDMLGVKLVEPESGTLLHQLDAPFRFGRSGFVFSRDSQLLARVATDKVVPVWSTKTGKLLIELQTEAHGGAFDDDGRWMATGFSDEKNGLAVWRLFDDASQPGARVDAKRR